MKAEVDFINRRITFVGTKDIIVFDITETETRKETTRIAPNGKTVRKTSVRRKNLVGMVKAKHLSKTPGKWVKLFKYSDPHVANSTAGTLRRKTELKNYEFSSEAGTVYGRYTGSSGK
jgi:hypothetical protein